MTDENKASKKEKATKEFFGIIDAASEFLKKMFPHAYTLIDKLRGVRKKRQ